MELVLEEVSNSCVENLCIDKSLLSDNAEMNNDVLKV